MSQNFNVEPYYDDFDPAKNYHRILFKPGYAIQARELTQTQSILQDQISKFADNIFKQNTPVTGGQVTTNIDCDYIKIESTYNSLSVNPLDFQGKIITDATGAIVARVIKAITATGTVGVGDPGTLIVSYESGNKFADGDVIYESTLNLTAQAIATAATGKSSVASINQGVFYISNNYKRDDGITISNGNFVQVNPQTIVLNKYDSSPTVRVGLNITETIQDYVGDTSLLDPALGASNYQAPGADRYQITLTLETRPLQLGDDEGFIELVRLENGKSFTMVDGTVYNVIDDYFAKRQFETNGDYVVNTFNINPIANTAYSSKYDVKVGKGTAYVQGYRLENSSPLVLTNDRARTTASQNNSSVFVDYGSYFYVNSVRGLFDVTLGSPVDLHITPVSNIVTTNTTTYSQTLAATGYIRNLVFDSYTTNSNTASYVYKAHIYNVSTKTLSSTVAAATGSSITFTDTTGKFSSVANAYTGVTLTIDAGSSTGDSRRISWYDGATKTAYVDTPFSITPDTTSNFSLRLGTKDVETVANTVSGTYGIAAAATINNLSKVNGIATNDTIYQNPQYPELVYNVGYQYVSTVDNGSYETTQVFRNKAFSSVGGTTTLSVTLPTGLQNSVDFAGGVGTISGDSIKQNYTVVITSTGDVANNGTVGSIMDFSTSGNTVSVSSDKNTLTLSSVYYKTPLTVSIIAKVNVTNADDASHILKTKTLVTGNKTTIGSTGPDGIINSYTYLDLTNGQVYIRKQGILGTGQQQSLYISDVKRVLKIIDTKDPATAPSLEMLDSSFYDITSHYSFSNGQEDSFYNHAYLSLNPGMPVPVGNILVIFDYYAHSGGDGYFSVKSYANEAYASIPNYVTKRGTLYSLRDCLDFRPTRKNATSSFVFDYTASPVTNDTGTYIPEDLSNFTADYSYYLGRKDRLVLTKDKSFQIVKGNPSVNPILPAQPDGSLVIANLHNDPYTAYIPSEATAGTLPNLSVEKIQHRRWTMGDISDLQTRINNIEYYTSLNALEQKTQSLQVSDANGLNRFKNGILVDDFSSYSTADTTNPDFFVSVDRVAKQMSATHDVSNYPLQSPVVLATMSSAANTEPLGFKLHSIGKVTNIFSLPYTNTEIISQRVASNTINLNPFTTPVYQGVVYLNPPMDNWVDNTKAPDLLIVDPNMQIYQQSDKLNVLNVTNWQTIPGTQYTVNAGTTYTIGHDINWSPFGYVGYSTTSTQTFASQVSNTTLGYWTNLGSSYSQQNGFITDISIQPYIRQQQLIFRAKQLKTNTPVHAFFDGVNVDNYIVSPDVIELTDVTGEFNENDSVGYYNSTLNKFFPIATVVSVYNYPNTKNTRLYVTSNFHSGFGDMITGASATRILQNAFFNTSGQYVSSTARGTTEVSKVIKLNNSGYLSSVGGAFTDSTGTSFAGLYQSWQPQATTFNNVFGVWSSPSSPGATVPTTFDASYTVNFPSTGTYYFGGDCSGSVTVYLDGTSILTGGPNSTQYVSRTVTAGNHTVRWRAVDNNTNGENNSQVAVAISTDAWNNVLTAGNIIFASNNPPGITPANSGSRRGMPAGGVYFVGVTQVALNPTASATNDFYVGCKINISTTFMSNATKAGQSTLLYTATITDYDGQSKMATLDRPVNVSLGFNCVLGTIVTSTYSIIGTQSSYLISKVNNGVPTLSTNENGDFVGVFTVPANTFRTGERVFRIDNRTTAEDAGSATTYAEATFTASGLATTSQSLNFGTSISAAKNTFTRTQYRDNVLVNTSTIINPWDPVAQTFIIDKKNYPNGAFLSNMKLFFNSKPLNTNTPVTMSIVNTLNGYPNGDTLDHSLVTLTADKVKVSANPHYLDPTTYTEFKFDAPVYIQPNILYAMVLVSQSTDYNIYTAAQNATALPSSIKALPTDPNPTAVTKIGNAPYVAALFESQNSITWTADPRKSMMFVVDRCKFDTTKHPKLQFKVAKNLPTRKLVTQDVQSYYSNNLVSNVNGIVSNEDVESNAYNLTTTDLVPTNTRIDYTYESLLKSTETFDEEKSVIPGKYGSPTYENLFLNDGKGVRLLSANNDAPFSMFASMSSVDDTVSPMIADDGTSLYNIKWNINNLQLSNSVISLVSGGSSYNVNTTTITVSAPDQPGGTQAVAGANVNSGVIDSVYIIEPGSGYLNTPTIDIVDANTGAGAVAIVASEFSSKGGNGVARYVTKKVTLAENNDSEDLRVYFTAYRPLNTNVHVFYRIQSKTDDGVFEDGDWQLMTLVNNTGGYSQNRSDLYEFEMAPGVSGVADNQISYTGTNGQTYTNFNQFAIKIVLTTSDNTSVPYLTDIRAIALPAGTGA